MKNIIITGLLLAIIGTACRKKDDSSIFGQKPEDRMNATLTAYKKQLTGSPGGWKAYLYPAGGSGFGFYFKLTDDNRVTMLSDIADVTGSTPKESSYRLSALQRPSLMFDTYSYLHLLSDPDRNVLGGQQGAGYFSDFEFGYDSTRNDTIFLTGNSKQSRLILIAATAAEETSYRAAQLNTIQEQLLDFTTRHTVLYLETADNKKVQVSVNTNSRELSLISLDKNGQFITKTYPYAHTLHGIFFKEVVAIDKYFTQELFLDTDKDQLFLKSGGNTVNILTSNVPVFPLHLLMGVSFKQINTSDATKAAFSTTYGNMWTTAKTAVAAIPLVYKLKLNAMNIQFDTDNKQMIMNFLVSQTVDGKTNNYSAPYVFNYSKTQDGVYKFLMEDPQGQVAQIVLPAVTPILNKVNGLRFKLDYLAIPGTPGQFGQMIGVDDPQIAIGGLLQ